MIFKILTCAEVVAYPCRNATIICGASEHILESCICLQDLKIRFDYKSNLTSAIKELANCNI